MTIFVKDSVADEGSEDDAYYCVHFMIIGSILYRAGGTGLVQCPLSGQRTRLALLATKIKVEKFRYAKGPFVGLHPLAKASIFPVERSKFSPFPVELVMILRERSLRCKPLLARSTTIRKHFSRAIKLIILEFIHPVQRSLSRFQRHCNVSIPRVEIIVYRYEAV